MTFLLILAMLAAPLFYVGFWVWMVVDMQRQFGGLAGATVLVMIVIVHGMFALLYAT